ncbi:ABC transporter ATP-binding protein [Deinococcus deserti]|uniref:Putative ABC transporter, ATP-binding component n=1 Tax=Deinococcus deserti (strain DSM 17065 / CIP 109153 / LMG 22923 / VCD115) TaxID=546414 RepID=C1CWI3_DEIDV|nr:ABC transporter ATP-binding protein [Deinococcus deserti]ACO46550.1 putative ABC transporter, ATP-binding component [Deinococcus deserti VCD115]
MVQVPQEPSPALRVQGLSKAFGTVQAAQDVSLTVQAGETLALLGPSGCGKSTVLRGVAGLERLDGGQVEVGGRNVTALPPEARHVGLVFQDYSLFPHLSVLDNVAYGPRMRGARRPDAQARAREVLALVDLSALEARRPAQLSGGQQQRVALARALATASPLLLLDEPLSNLDEKLRAQLRTDLHALFARVEAGVLLVTHDQREALALAHRVAVMRAGRIVQQNTAAEVFARPATAWVASFLGHQNVLPHAEGQALLIPELAVHLGTGPQYTITSNQVTESGETITVAHSLGLLTLHLSPRERNLVHGKSLQLELDSAVMRLIPDDRSPSPS